MKKQMIAVLIASAMLTLSAQGDVQESHEWSWSPNVGWVKWRTSATDGAHFSQTILSGWIYSANIGWICLGSGHPLNGYQYTNANGTDYGINVDAASDSNYYLLSGYAYGPNIGWLNFSVYSAVGDQDRPRIDKRNGLLKGYIYGANIGWMPVNIWEHAMVDTQMRDAVKRWSLYE